MLSAAWVPNAITVMRLLLVVPVAVYLWQRDYVAACVLVALAGASDVVDGWLARRLKSTTSFGAMADPVADKALSLTVFVLLAIQEHLPVALVAVVVVRDVIIVSGAATFRLLYGPFDYAPTLAGKVSTACQIVLVLVVLARLAAAAPTGHWLMMLQHFAAFGVVASAIVSGGEYVFIWARKALHQHRVTRDGPR